MTFGTARLGRERVAFRSMATILTIACELALLGLLWLLWRESARADREIRTLTRQSSDIAASKFE
jgi:hypothetical protein